MLPNGEYVVSESIVGGLWLIGRDGEIRRGLVPDDGAPPLQELGAVPVRGRRRRHGRRRCRSRRRAASRPARARSRCAARDLYISSTCQGGVQRLPIRVLLDDARPAAERAERIVDRDAAAQNALESLKGITFNRWDRGRPVDLRRRPVRACS